MQTNTRPSDLLVDKLIEGLRRAARKLVEQRAAENKTLVVLVNDKPTHVPARELLRQFKEE